ncbi:MAG: exodeoxyribonuclease VII large subunit [Firmicutes bacterium]|nr:exodeoxyribonuclease VII large subunit [Bacillota bacterium]
MSTSAERAAAWPAGAPWGGVAPAGQVLTVSQLTERIRARIASDPCLASQVAVTGELSNVKAHSGSGHLYFSLKDRNSRVACVMWRNHAQRLGFEPRDGMQVVATGYVDVYAVAGVYQLYVQGLYPVGLGLLYARLQELYQRLSQEGLFDEARKRPLPPWPRGVGVVTSPDGAALRDVVAVFRRRSPRTPLVLSPALVQGDGAVESLIRALERVVQVSWVDVVIVARGGGSAEDLWIFNDERLVRAVAACPKPVVCAIGHETDVTLAELAADRRAPTPSAAAEVAGPDEESARLGLRQQTVRLERAVRRHLARLHERLHRAASRPALVRPDRWLGRHRQRLDELVMREEAAVRRARAGPRLAWAALSGRLSASSPLETLARGYALVQEEATGRWVRRAAEVEPGAHLRLRMRDGALRCRVLARLEGAADGDGAGLIRPGGAEHGDCA